MSTTDGWLKLNFATCVILQTRSLGAIRTTRYIVLFQDFTIRSISGPPTVRGTASIQYIARRVFTRVCRSISRSDTLDILSVLAVIGLQHNCSHTPSTCSISAASSTPILSVLPARNKSTRYSEHTWKNCCDASCCSCCS